MARAATGALPDWIRAWLRFEQRVNAKRINPDYFHSIQDASDLPASYLPESQPVFRLSAVHLPKERARIHGAPLAALRDLLDYALPEDRIPLFVHPLSTDFYRDLLGEFPLQQTPLLASPTASVRSLVVWNEDRPGSVAMIKLSVAARLGTALRVLKEREVVRAYLNSRILEQIPQQDLARFHFDFFPNRGGVVDAASATGYSVRAFPSFSPSQPTGTLCPAFSLMSPDGTRAPLLIRALRSSQQSAAAFLEERVVAPYVEALAYLLFVEGLGFQGHCQNVLFEVGPDDALTKTVVIRDLGGMNLNILTRTAMGRSLPPLRSEIDKRFPFAPAHAVHVHTAPKLITENVIRNGLHAVIWELSQMLVECGEPSSAERLRAAYLERWQELTRDALGLVPEIDCERGGIALADAVDHLADCVDWATMGLDPFSGRSEGALSVRLYDSEPEAWTEELATTWGKILFEDRKPIALLPYSAAECGGGSDQAEASGP